MAEVAVLNMQGKEVGRQQLSDAVFGIEPNVPVMNDMVKNYLANQRQGTQSALRARAAPARAAPALPSGPTAAWYSPQSPGITAMPSTRR